MDNNTSMLLSNYSNSNEFIGNIERYEKGDEKNKEIGDQSLDYKLTISNIDAFYQQNILLIENLTNKNMQLQEQLVNLSFCKEKIIQLHDENNDLRMKVIQNEGIKELLKQLENSNKEKEIKLNSLQEEVEKSRNQNAEKLHKKVLSETVKDLQTQVNDMKKEIKKKTQELKDVYLRLNEKESEVAAAKEEHEILYEKYAKYLYAKAVHDVSEEREKNLQSQIDELINQIQEKDHEIRNIKILFDTNLDKLNKLQAENEKITKDNFRLIKNEASILKKEANLSSELVVKEKKMRKMCSNLEECAHKQQTEVEHFLSEYERFMNIHQNEVKKLHNLLKRFASRIEVREVVIQYYMNMDLLERETIKMCNNLRECMHKHQTELLQLQQGTL